MTATVCYTSDKGAASRVDTVLCLHDNQDCGFADCIISRRQPGAINNSWLGIKTWLRAGFCGVLRLCTWQFIPGSVFIRAKRVSNCYIPKKKLCVCSHLGFSGEKNCACVRLILVLVWYQIRMYMVSAGRNLYVRTLCSARGRTRLTTVTSISCRSL